MEGRQTAEVSRTAGGKDAAAPHWALWVSLATSLATLLKELNFTALRRPGTTPNMGPRIFLPSLMWGKRVFFTVETGRINSNLSPVSSMMANLLF